MSSPTTDSENPAPGTTAVVHTKSSCKYLQVHTTNDNTAPMVIQVNFRKKLLLENRRLGT